MTRFWHYEFWHYEREGNYRIHKAPAGQDCKDPAIGIDSTEWRDSSKFGPMQEDQAAILAQKIRELTQMIALSPTVSLVALTSAPSTVRLADDDREMIRSGFAAILALLWVLVRAVAKRTGFALDEDRDETSALTTSSLPALPPADVIVTHHPMLAAARSSAIVTRSN